MKTHVRKTGNVEENKWKIFITDDNLDTYFAVIEREEYPSRELILNEFQTNRGSFKLMETLK